jgi:hypothetical protein
MQHSQAGAALLLMHRKVTLIETPGGWLWAEYDRNYKSLSAAQRAVARDSEELARRYSMVVTMIEYTPNTPAGSIIVKALTTEKEAK